MLKRYDGYLSRAVLIFLAATIVYILYAEPERFNIGLSLAFGGWRGGLLLLGLGFFFLWLALRALDTRASPFDALTERELQTCLMITDSCKIGDIADYFHVSPKTINTYRYRIFAKLQVSGDVEMALLMVRHRLVEINAVPSG